MAQFDQLQTTARLACDAVPDIQGRPGRMHGMALHC